MQKKIKKEDESNNNKRMLMFLCHACKISMFIFWNEDPTSSSGCCKVCGDHRWNIYDASGEKVE